MSFGQLAQVATRKIQSKKDVQAPIMRQRNLKGNRLNEKVGLREAWCFMSELRCEKAPGISAKTRQLNVRIGERTDQ